MWKRTNAKTERRSKKTPRKLRSDERERVQDTMQLVQSAKESIAEMDGLIPEHRAIEECFEMADRSLREALETK